MKRQIKTVLAAVLIAGLLSACGNEAEKTFQSVNSIEMQSDTVAVKTEEKQPELPENPQPDEKPTVEKTKEEPQEKTEEIPTGTEETAEPPKPEISDENPDDGVLTCSLSVRCDTILNNIANLDKNKTDLVPTDGKIFETDNAVFYEGESVFNLLSRELRKNSIHFEFTKNPAYNSVYIEGIGNLYEHDCGELSGWMYRVNGKIPGYGCSQYILGDGDKVEFLYSCNMGEDIK